MAVNLFRTTLLCLVVFLFIPGFYAKAWQKNQGFVIKGHIDGIEDNTPVYLYDIDGSVTIDSANSYNGDFVLKGSVSQPITCWLRCKDEYAIIQVENTEMTFNSPITNMVLCHTTKGGKEQALSNELTALQFPYHKVYLSAYDSIMKKKYKDLAHRERLVTIFNDAQSASLNIYVQFGLKHPASYIGLDILYRNRKTILPDSLKICYGQLSDALRATSKAAAIKEYFSGNLAKEGEELIDFTVQSIDGKSFTLSSLKGNYILLNFWSTTCAPCRLENKEISRNYNKYDKKIYIVNFLIDKNKKAWLEASKADGILWTNVSDLQGNDGKIKTQYNVQAIPTSFLINKEGIIIKRFTGFDEAFLSKFIH